MAKSAPYKDFLYSMLADPDEAFGYLNEVLQDYQPDDITSHNSLIICLDDIVKARGGINQLSQKTSVKQNLLEKILHEGETPSLAVLTNIIGAVFDCEVRLQVVPKELLEGETAEEKCEEHKDCVPILKQA